ncbi:MAG: isoprenyl transferase [Clostridiales bacterium]|nr:isoprenyl transferase [Clostridiales bacterium]
MADNPSIQTMISLIKSKPVPQHIAIIMDGNGRWAKMHGFVRTVGHRYGVEKLKELLVTCKAIGIKYVTVYAFSTENWSRPKDEVDTLMRLIVEFINREIDNIKKEGARIRVLGDYSVLPEESRNAVEYAIAHTAENTDLHLNVALNYGGRAEIVKAVKEIAQKISSGELSLDDVGEKTVSDHLYTAGMPDPDLVIRTAGEMRLSNFLPYQSAYSEIWVSPPDVFWPDFGKEVFLRAIMDYQKRDRRFGGLSSK